MSSSQQKCEHCEFPQCSVADTDLNVEIRVFNVHTEVCYPFIKNSKGQNILVANPGEEFGVELTGLSEKTKSDGAIQAEIFVDGRNVGQDTTKRLSITYPVRHDEPTWIIAFNEGDSGYYALKFHDAGAGCETKSYKMGTMCIKLWSTKRRRQCPKTVVDKVVWKPGDKFGGSNYSKTVTPQSVGKAGEKFWKSPSLFAGPGRKLKTTVATEMPFRTYSRKPLSSISFPYETAEKLSLNGTLSPTLNEQDRIYFFGSGKDRWEPHKRIIMQGSSVDQVKDYISSFGKQYRKYALRFEEMEIDGDGLINDVNENVLKTDIRVKSPFHLNRMWRLISQVQIRELRKERLQSHKRHVDMNSCDLTSGEERWSKCARVAENG